MIEGPLTRAATNELNRSLDDLIATARWVTEAVFPPELAAQEYADAADRLVVLRRALERYDAARDGSWLIKRGSEECSEQ